MSQTEIAHEKHGHCGIITLNRPRALNALTLEMIEVMAHALDAFARDPQVHSVVLRSATSNAFCAGADIKRVAEWGRTGLHAEQLAFLAAEYRNCYRIKTYSKPYVSLIDGIIMGGGAGIAVNGAHRIAGDRITFAMPEVVIGFFPDVGATYFLPRLPHAIGTYLALTGGRASLGDVMALGLATAHVPSARFDVLVERLTSGDDVHDAVAAQTVAPPPSDLLREGAFIGRAFSQPNLAAIFKKVEAEANSGSDFAKATLETLRSRSPTSLAIALRQTQIGAELTFEEALQTEFRIAARIVHGHDFYEGVRATLVDKDHKPRWDPAEITRISEADIEAYFASSGAALKLPQSAGVL